ncbi:ABC transporter permease [Pirellulaceae bacterium]|jgi:ABC-2 type transport system permease protein|nr:ABC transporter permease [Pirellulaceae bacterium]
MIRTAIRASWLNLKRDRLALVLTFVVPIIFFTVFATIFSSMSSGGSKVKIFVVDEAQNSFSTRIHKALEKDKETFVFPSEKYLLNKLNTNPNEPDETELTAKNLEKLVSDGHITLGVVLPQDFKISFQNASEKVKVFADTKANPIAYQMINGILQKVAMTHAPGAMFGQGIKMLEQFGGELTKQQSKLVENLSKQLASNNEKGSKPGNETVEATKSDAGFRGLVTTEILDVREQADQRRGRKNRAAVSFYASGIAVMFLLFSMTSAASSILEEEEMGTLERVLDSKLGLNGFLLSHWLFTAALGFVQIFVMFAWGAIGFGLDLWSTDHLIGFTIVTAVTSAAAASFGLLLGSICHTRAQLNGLSTTVVLVMSALGGSMIPRFFMKQNATMELVGNFTFNAWAIDAYENIFWKDKTISESPLQLIVMATMAVVFLSLAWLFAQRWKRN